MTWAVLLTVGAVAGFGAGLGLAEDGQRLVSRVGGFTLMAVASLAFIAAIIVVS